MVESGNRRKDSTVYDNSATMALAGSGVTMLGQTASLTVLTVGGALFAGLGLVLAVTERVRRKRGASS